MQRSNETVDYPAFTQLAEHRFVCIGDIHGHFTRLRLLWKRLLDIPDFDSYLVVFIGDYVNRGPRVFDTIEFLAQIKATRPNTVFLMGNHEYPLLSHLGLLPGNQYVHPNGEWSEGCPIDDATRLAYDISREDSPAEILAKIPASHQHFFSELQYVHEIPGFIFVHGGLVNDQHQVSGSVQHQLSMLRDVGYYLGDRPRQIFDHDTFEAPSELIGSDTCVVSGHHATMLFLRNRIIIDNIGDSLSAELYSFVYPQFILLGSEGSMEVVDTKRVFP
jgi:predicted MPP superfamily phosphohydrolase